MTNENDIICARALKHLRKTRGNKTQMAVAQDLGLNDQHRLSDYECGKKSFSEEFIQKICTYFNITEAEFKKLGKKLSNDKSVLKSKAIQQTQEDNISAEDYKLKWLLSCKEIANLKLVNERLNLQLYEEKRKVKFLYFNHAAPKDIYVIV